MVEPKSKSTYIYRIMQYHHVVQLFTKKKLYFSHPSQWDDPYETRVKHDWEHMLYAQCWGTKSMSDAMWRIYSQHQTSLRIKTTRAKLLKAMEDFAKQKNGYKRRLGDVTYHSTENLNKKTRDLAKQITTSTKPLDAVTAAVDILCLKRIAFEHEREVRAILYCPSEDGEKANPGIFINIEPHDFIESILIDPRAPDELFDAFKNHFENILKFKGTIQKSALYRTPEPFTLEEED